MSRVRENRMPGSMRRREETGTSRAHTRRAVLAPPADPTATRRRAQCRFARMASAGAGHIGRSHVPLLCQEIERFLDGVGG